MKADPDTLAFLPEIYVANRMKVGCTCVQILCLPQWRHYGDQSLVKTILLFYSV